DRFFAGKVDPGEIPRHGPALVRVARRKSSRSWDASPRMSIRSRAAPRTVGQGRYQHDGTVLGFFVFETSVHRRRTLAGPARAHGKIARAEINHRRTISRICQQRRDWQSPGKFAAEGRLQRIQPARGQSDHQRDRPQKTEELRRSLTTSPQCGRDLSVPIIWESRRSHIWPLLHLSRTEDYLSYLL